MTGRMNWTRQQKRGRPTEQAVPRDKLDGPWTHIKREPVRPLTREEIAALIAQRPDLRPSRSRARRPEGEG